MENEKQQNLLFLDVEATGLEKEDRLVQVAYSYKGEEQEQMFKPEEQEMCVRAMEVTHITNKHLADKKSFQGSDFYEKLKIILEKDETIFIAHNAPYDIEMIEKENLKTGKFIDTFKIVQHLDTEAKIPFYRLQYLRYHFGMEVDANAHDALGDVRVLVALFEKLYDEMSEKLSHEEVIEKMIKISSEATLIKRINFGKHKGELISDVARKDKGYLQWLLQQKEFAATNDDVDADWIYTLRKYV
ncbi:MAG: hypothetical protein KAT32_00935 [Candidatus Moranbacteria bacterium]|nr:hypothetical protein [Candidatus Moranbacteria bacterium]